MVAAANPIIIYGNQFDQAPNRKVGEDHVEAFLDSSNGAFRTLQLLDRVTQLAANTLKQAGSAMSASFDKAAGSFRSGWAALTIPRLYVVTKAFFETSDPKQPKSYIQQVHDTADFVATWGWAGLFVTGNPVYKNVAEVPDLVSNTTDLVMSGQEWALANDHLKEAQKFDERNKVVEQRFADTRTYALLKMVKSATSVFSGVLGLLVLSYGGPILPAVALISIGLVGTVSALASHFFKETRAHELVKFDKLTFAV